MIDRLMIKEVKRGDNVVADEIEMETYESGWLSLTQGDDCIVIEPEQFEAIVAFAVKHNLHKLKAENEKAWRR